MPPKKPAAKEDAIPCQFFVDYAPSGRASCKRCGDSIKQLTPRFCRKVRSAWHDGFDVQTSHLACGTKWVSKLSEIHFLGWLEWDDLRRAADEWEEDLDLTDESVKRTRALLDGVSNVKKILLDSKVPPMTLMSILRWNDYSEETLGKGKAPDLCQIVADLLSRGKLPPCPICEQTSLIPAGESVYCRGWVDTTTRCDFWVSWSKVFCPVSPYTKSLPAKVIDALKTRDANFLIPPTLAQLPVWRKVSGILKQISARYPDVSFKSKAVSGTAPATKKCPKVKTETGSEVPDDEELTGCVVGALGALDTPRSDLEDLVVQHGGLYIDNPSKIGDIPPGHRGILLANPESWKTVKTGVRASQAVSSGAIILGQNWLSDLLKKPSKDDDAQPCGKILRLAKNMQSYRLDGCRAFDIPIPTPGEKAVVKGIVSCPRIIRSSNMMQIDEWFPYGQEDVQKLYQIYVDRYNHAFSVNLTFVDLGGGKNSFYNIQLIEAFSIVPGRGGKKRRTDHASGKPKRVKREENKENEEVTDETEAFETHTANPFLSPIIDHTGLTDDDWQELQSRKISRFYVFRKWGRTGDNDKRTNDSLTEDFGNDLEAAVKSFRTKFQEMTGIDFFSRFETPGRPGKYQLVELAGYDRDGTAKIEKKPKKEKPAAPSNASSLLPAIQKLLNFVYNTELIRSSLGDMRLDTSKLDLEKLSLNQLKTGYGVLSEIEQIINEKRKTKGDAVQQSRLALKLKGLTGRFYVIVPHAFSVKEVPAPISTLKEVRLKCELLADFIETAESARLIHETESNDADKLDGLYRCLSCDVEPLASDTPVYKLIQQLIKNGHAATHNAFAVQLTNAFSLKPRNSAQLDRHMHNRKLLWHGSRCSNWGSILRHGLKIAPPEAPASGYMFDKGVYFADMVSKSAQYCNASVEQPRALLLLCEVALGTQYLRLAADEHLKAKVLRSDCQSCWGVGQNGLNGSCSRFIHKWFEETRDQIVVGYPKNRNEVEVLCGPQASNKLAIEKAAKERTAGGTKSQLLYNEYIVYDTSQIIPRFLVEVEFTFISFLDQESSASSASDTSSDEST